MSQLLYFDLGIKICQTRFILIKIRPQRVEACCTGAACTFLFHKIWSEENRGTPHAFSFDVVRKEGGGGSPGDKTWLGNGPFPLFATGDKTNQTMCPVGKGGTAVCLSKDVLLIDLTGPTRPVRDPDAEPDSRSFGPLPDAE